MLRISFFAWVAEAAIIIGHLKHLSPTPCLGLPGYFSLVKFDVSGHIIYPNWWPTAAPYCFSSGTAD